MNTYVVTFDRATRKITIEANGNFDLLCTTGSHSGSAPWGMMGFSTAQDLTGADEYTGQLEAGDVYRPQFWLQDYIPSTDWQEAVDATVNETATGEVNVTQFGIRKFIQMNIKFATNLNLGPRSIVRRNPTGKEDLTRFMQYITSKAPVEFIHDENSPSTYETIVLESTPENQKGVGFKLKELYDQNFPDCYQTGLLKFRVQEDT